jgi:hypothetical protein
MQGIMGETTIRQTQVNGAGFRRHCVIFPLVDQRMTEVECYSLDDHVTISFASLAAGSKRAEEWLSASGTIAVAANHPAFAAKVTGGSHYERVIHGRRRKGPR